MSKDKKDLAVASLLITLDKILVPWVGVSTAFAEHVLNMLEEEHGGPSLVDMVIGELVKTEEDIEQGRVSVGLDRIKKLLKAMGLGS